MLGMLFKSFDSYFIILLNKQFSLRDTVKEFRAILLANVNF